ncbi:MAG: threonine/serine dehydratase [Gammaproteobacteria bacterium]|nr:threonine/serine dehydratase [Gammaproteobacteria bacterium]MDH5239838.1 threonine/serine dehydratase [Gammaproteobacteria bacterium]MDH5260699.1 threonine/serine dehydratase [Gammaproteobacteria bacterium]
MAEYGPKIAEIYALRERLGDQVFRTPVLQCPAIEEKTGGKTTVFAKLEFLQRTGTFKARGALATLHGLSAEERMRGVTAVSAGNHAIAVAFAAATVGTTAKVVMTRSANPFRVAACAAYGAEVVLADDVHLAFALAEEIRDKEGRYFIHPFEGPSIALGTGTMGVEICEQIPEFDAIVIPVGGGGLIGGIANAVRQMRPDAEIIGVEPVGADSMHRSFASGTPQGIEKVATIADSLGAPFALPYSFELTRQNVDRLVTVDDDQLKKCMGFLFRSMKIAVEPACVATTAALLGPLRESMRGRRAVLVMCGSNIDWQTFVQQAVFEDVA